ncbi:MAG: hypothetical protein MAG795_01078 [Candidatus Woesearchaeota archaeon]|nr:hypothetical protein [Candidatus Woesearchaeota archaeon]
MENLTIIGTSHIASQSINEIKKSIKEIKPDIIALELDKQRFVALHQKKRNINLLALPKVGINGFLFSIIGSYVQKKLGRKVGIKPGAEMLTAAKLAKENNIILALVDQDIEVTLKNFSKALNWREKYRIFKDIITGILRKDPLFDDIKKIDLTKVPKEEIVDKLMKELKKRYPTIYKVLVEDRNKYMAKKISQILLKEPDKEILAIVGAGHKKELKELIHKYTSDPKVDYVFNIAM